MKERLKKIWNKMRRLWLRLLILLRPLAKWLRRLPWHRLAWVKKLNPFRYIKRRDLQCESGICVAQSLRTGSQTSESHRL